MEIIDLGVGDPDIPTPDFIIEALKKAADDPKIIAILRTRGCPHTGRQ
ncbi:MAG: hypothetical protein R3B51_03880 [Thermodesulfobacteriota bacterium]